MTTDFSPRQQRDKLLAKLESVGVLRSAEVKDAFLSVPRHVFLPEVSVQEAYAPHPVVTKRASDGLATSSASSPSIVATMLEQLSVAPGHNVLEIGAATGINAALLSELIAPTGHVTTIELDRDLADGARTHLAAAGYDAVTVHCGDGALGAPDTAPYDRIIVTAGAWTIPNAWWDQLTPNGRLVVPLSLHECGLTRSLAFDRVDETTMVATDTATCGFVPMRGSIETSGSHIQLTDGALLKTGTTNPESAERLPTLFTTPEQVTWTGLTVRHDEPVAHLDLWLATHCDDHQLRYGKLAVTKTARQLGVADPTLQWSGAALYAPDGSALAYLVTRPIAEDVDEIGVAARGAASATDGAVRLLTEWDRARPAHPTVTAHRAPGCETTVTIAW